MMLVIRDRDDAETWRWLLIGIGAVAAFVFASELPALRRYLKLRSM